jgi:hypothetical protein
MPHPYVLLQFRRDGLHRLLLLLVVLLPQHKP